MLRGAPTPRPNEFIYPSRLKPCSDPRLTSTLHPLLSMSGFHDFAVVRTALVDSYSRFSDTDAAPYLFNEMSQRNVVSWTALLTGYMRTGQMGKALFMFEEMPDMDVPAWNVVISGCTQNGLFSEALSFFSRMVIDGARPNKTTVSASSPLVCILKARWIFSTMSEKNITSWNSMINCLALQGHSSLAIETFREMEQEGPQPNQVTFMGLLNAYLLSQAGRFDAAMDIVRDMRIVPDVVVWGSLLNGARVHGAKDLAELALRKLLESNLRVLTMASCSQIYTELKQLKGRRLP
ncbi:hypothetical protein ZIOFF_014231 [Zingiber officinale]|uniref:Pentatricopeptide repeat-containing protein n=1 Tax=Zingiber officinale TaxID=94328 RepID=A0A8J5LPC1_ZINOF|nr:hypothetical protein ZIOFF_014231 [Zingiber officinale]